MMIETELADSLRMWAKGHRPIEAAVGLLIAHHTWVARAVGQSGPTPSAGARLVVRPTTDPSTAGIDWEEAIRLSTDMDSDMPAQDRQMLAIAVALAGERTSALHLSLVGLDDANLAIVSRALEHYFTKTNC